MREEVTEAGSLKNMIEINKNYTPTLYAVQKASCLYGFYASDKLEPYVICTVIAMEGGKLTRLSMLQVTLH